MVFAKVPSPFRALGEAEFGSAVEAVRCAISCQEEISSCRPFSPLRS